MGMHLAYVALGGALGSLLRAVLGSVVAFPFGTLSVKVLGSLAIGLAFGAGRADRAIAPFLLLGVLGGCTTFSTFSLDALKLVQAGAIGSAASYVLAAVILSLLAVALGYILGSRVF